jgi:hypothetical protein
MDEPPRKAFDIIAHLSPWLHRLASASIAALVVVAAVSASLNLLWVALVVFVAVLFINPNKFSVLRIFVDVQERWR